MTPIWRSLLFVPAHVEKIVAGASRRGADACILDLEDSVPREHKAQALTRLPDAVARLRNAGVGVLVRINQPVGAQEIEVCVKSRVDAILLPKVETATDVSRAAQLLDRAGADSEETGLLAQIESVQAMPALDSIAVADSRLLGMSLGSEDFSLSAGMQPVPEALLWPNQQIVFACRRAGILPFGFPASITDYQDLAAFRAHVRLGRQLGFVGAFCIHPTQVNVLNDEFAPAPDAVQEARELMRAYEAALAKGHDAFAFRGRMVDLPVIQRAKALLAFAAQIAQREKFDE